MVDEITLTGGSAPANAWVWRWMDRERAASLWVELGEWVSWLRETYQFKSGQFPDCWYRHPAAVEELTALMAAHKAAYPNDAAATAYRSDMTSWHTHELWPAMNRLKDIGGFADCDSRECRYEPTTIRTMPGFEEFIANDVDGRPEPVQPLEDATQPDSMAGDYIAETGGETIRVKDMKAAIAADLAELIDPENAFGPVLFEDRRWIYSSAHKGYIPDTNVKEQ
ncbi:hypothetical protein GS538_09070 [Rhodococcus hoagii]|nr:hypothetical protein [Prescottella equi]